MKYVVRIILAFLITFSMLYSQEGVNNENPKKGRLIKPLERDKHFVRQRAYPNEEIPDGARVKAYKQMEQMMYEKNSPSLMLAQQPEWKNIGPFSIGGRIKSIVCHPTIDGTVYIGAAAGGVWKTTNFGADWAPLFDFENGIAFGSLGMDMNNPNIIYAGTGEAVMGGYSYMGAGMYKTTDGGLTWKIVGLPFVGAFSKVFVHPLNSNLIYAGAVKRGKGFYKSTDAGETWQKMLDATVSDVSININNENEVIIGVTGVGTMYTSDGGNNWEDRSTGFETGVGRVSVQFAPSNPDIVYALAEIMGIGTIYKSTNRGKGWVISYKGQESFFNGQGFYDNFISVFPTNPNVVIAGGIDIFRTINGGGTWSNVTNGYSGGSVHVDQHHACFNPLNPNQIYLGNDGGMYRSNDAGQNWTEINNNLQVTQFYSLAIDKSKENLTYGGTQDNGTLGNNALQSNWQLLFGGDGFRTLVDYDRPDVIYGESTPGGNIMPFRKNMKTGATSYLSNGLDNDYVWDPPLVMDPTENYILYHGRANLYVSYDNGDHWDKIAPKGLSGRFSAIAVSPVDGMYIVAGTEVGEVIFSTDGGTTWSLVTDNGLVNRWVKDFAFSRVDAGTCYAVFSGFGVPHVFKTTNAGAKWVSISEGLPDISTNTITLHPENENMIFIGTDIGVFASFDGGSSWFPYGHGMARSPVLDLEFNHYYLGEESIPLRAATHGRSIWEVGVTNEKITSPEITAPAGGELFTSSTPQLISWYGFTPPVSVEYSVNDGATWSKIADYVQGLTMRWLVPNRPTINARIKVTSMTEPSQVAVSNTFTINMIDIGSVLKLGGVSYIPYGIAYDGKAGLWSTSFQTNKLTKLNADNFFKEKEFTLPGDSLYSDLAFDKSTGLLYIHRMNNTQGGGGYILVVDTTGTLIKQYKSPGQNYPIGLELVDGKLLVGDRDYRDDFGNRTLWYVDKENGNILSTFVNPFQKTYGPRGLSYDGKEFVFQVCTDFPNAGALTAAYVLKMDKNNPANELARMPLESLDGIINGRGIDYDPRDQNLWISDYGGNIYKVAGFETVVSVEESDIVSQSSLLESKVYPNPAGDYTTLSVKNLSNGNATVSAVLFNLLGETVTTAFDKYLESGDYANVSLDLSAVPAGVYEIAFFVNGRKDISRKIVVMK